MSSRSSVRYITMVTTPSGILIGAGGGSGQGTRGEMRVNK